MAIITIKELLELRSKELIGKRIKLVRHKDNRPSKTIKEEVVEGDPYIWYRNDKNKFLEYQAEQHKDVFKNVDYIVSFIGENSKTARFIGVYKVHGKSEKYGDKFHYLITEVEGFDELKERVKIDWGKSTLSWHQWLNSENDKDIIEIIPGYDYLFPGYDNVSLTLSQLKNIIIDKEYSSWKQMLSSINAIYVISDRKTGKLYVGSSYGKEGLWRRWKIYAETNGHGNNVELENLLKQNFNYARDYFVWSIIKVLPIDILQNTAVEKEQRIKEILGKEACSLNKN